MQNYAPNTAVTVTAQLTDEAGNILVPTSIQWRLLDEADAELQTWTALSVPTPGEPVVSVVVSDALNTLAVGVTRGMRRVEFKVVTAIATHVLASEYLLQGASVLTFGVNTFLTYSQAQLLAMDFAHVYLMSWHNAVTRDDREQALIQAHGRIIKLPFNLEFEEDQSRIIYHPWGKSSFDDLTPAQIADLKASLLRAIKRAQLIEAAYILTEDGVTAARKDGLMSMTVGESSQFFRPSKPLDLGVSREAYRELFPYLIRSNRIGRA